MVNRNYKKTKKRMKHKSERKKGCWAENTIQKTVTRWEMCPDLQQAYQNFRKLFGFISSYAFHLVIFTSIDHFDVTRNRSFSAFKCKSTTNKRKRSSRIRLPSTERCWSESPPTPPPTNIHICRGHLLQGDLRHLTNY